VYRTLIGTSVRLTTQPAWMLMSSRNRLRRPKATGSQCPIVAGLFSPQVKLHEVNLERPPRLEIDLPLPTRHLRSECNHRHLRHGPIAPLIPELFCRTLHKRGMSSKLPLKVWLVGDNGMARLDPIFSMLISRCPRRTLRPTNCQHCPMKSHSVRTVFRFSLASPGWDILCDQRPASLILRAPNVGDPPEVLCLPQRPSKTTAPSVLSEAELRGPPKSASRLLSRYRLLAQA